MTELQRKDRFKVLLSLYLAFAACVTLPLPFTGPIGTSFFVFLGSGCASCIWGLTLQYLEGRRQTDLLFAAVNSVVIFGPSVVRSVGEVLRRAVGVEREVGNSIYCFFSPRICSSENLWKPKLFTQCGGLLRTLSADLRSLDDVIAL